MYRYLFIWLFLAGYILCIKSNYEQQVDFYRFSQIWAPNWGGPTNFTIHGLWPERYNNTFPEYCQEPCTFNSNVLITINKSLSKVWTNFSGNNTKFLQHEWCKHGTCQNMTEVSFFKQGLYLYYKLSTTEKFLHNYIYPGYKYNISTIYDLYPYRINLSCKNNYLYELLICLNKVTFSPFDCPPMKFIDPEEQCGKLLYLAI